MPALSRGSLCQVPWTLQVRKGLTSGSTGNIHLGRCREGAGSKCMHSTALVYITLCSRMGEGRTGIRPLLPRTSPSPPNKVKRSEWRMGGLDKVPSPGAHHPCSPPPPLPHPAYSEWTEKSAPQLSTLLGRAKKKRDGWECCGGGTPRAVAAAAAARLLERSGKVVSSPSYFFIRLCSPVGLPSPPPTQQYSSGP